MNLTTAFRRTLEQRLQSFERRGLPESRLKRAAVSLVLVPDDDGQASVVVTRRAASLRRHSGQFALPGGRVDAGESAQQAALREVREEVGLDLQPEDVLGQLDDFVTRSGFHISTTVMWGVAGGELIAEPAEVAAIYRLPISTLAQPDTARSIDLDGGQPVLALAVLDTLIFAPTAAILWQFAELAAHDRTTRVSHHEQPRFAWG